VEIVIGDQVDRLWGRDFYVLKKHQQLGIEACSYSPFWA